MFVVYLLVAFVIVVVSHFFSSAFSILLLDLLLNLIIKQMIEHTKAASKEPPKKQNVVEVTDNKLATKLTYQPAVPSKRIYAALVFTATNAYSVEK